MATFNAFNQAIERMVEDANLGTDAFKIALTNTAPDAGDTELADITQITAGNGYTAGGETVTVSSSSQTAGTFSWVIDSDVVFTASGGSMATFRYIVLYDDTLANDPVLYWWDHGSAISLGDGSSATIDIGGVTVLSGSVSAA